MDGHSSPLASHKSPTLAMGFRYAQWIDECRAVESKWKRPGEVRAVADRTLIHE